MSIIKSKPSFGPARRCAPVLIESNSLVILESLAKEQQVAPEICFHNIVEETLAFPSNKARFVEYLQENWLEPKVEGKPSERFRLRPDTLSLLQYLSFTAGLEKRLGAAAEFLISYKASTIGNPIADIGHSMRMQTATIQ